MLSFLHSPTLTSIHDHWENIALPRWPFVSRVTSLILNMLSGLAIAFFQGASVFLISWLQSASAVILEPPKIKSDTVPTVSPSISHEDQDLGNILYQGHFTTLLYWGRKACFTSQRVKFMSNYNGWCHSVSNTYHNVKYTFFYTCFL